LESPVRGKGKSLTQLSNSCKSQALETHDAKNFEGFHKKKIHKANGHQRFILKSRTGQGAIEREKGAQSICRQWEQKAQNDGPCPGYIYIL
jgi:hypothetical protein